MKASDVLRLAISVLCMDLALAMQLGCKRPAAEPKLVPRGTLEVPLDPKMTIELLPEARLRIDGVEADLVQARVRSKELHLRDPGAQVLLIAGEEIETAELATVIELLHGVGLHDLVFSIDPPERAAP